MTLNFRTGRSEFYRGSIKLSRSSQRWILLRRRVASARSMTLDPVELMCHFLLNVLPSGLVRIHRSLFLANRFALVTCTCAAICSLFAKIASRFPQPGPH